MEEREMTYEVENKTTEETNVTTEQETSKGGFWIVAGVATLLTVTVIGGKALWDKFGPKKKEADTVNNVESSEVESAEEEETESEEAAK